MDEDTKGQELHESFQSKMRDQGVSIDDWQDIGHHERAAWEALAVELEDRGWKGV